MPQNGGEMMGVQYGSAGNPVGPKADMLTVANVIFIDRTTGLFYQVYIDNGQLQTVQVTL